MKRFFALALAILMVVVALPHSPAKAADKSLQIYLTSIDQPTQDWFNKTAFPAFQKDNPGVTLEVITGTWGDFDTSLAGWFATGKGPDILYLGSEYAPVYGKLLANLDTYINAKTFPALSKYLPGAIQTVTFDGHLRGLPLLFSPRPIFYRTDLVKGAPALKDFKPPLTFTDAVKFAKITALSPAVQSPSKPSSMRTLVHQMVCSIARNSSLRSGRRVANCIRRMAPAPSTVPKPRKPSSSSMIVAVQSCPTKRPPHCLRPPSPHSQLAQS